MRRFLTSTTAAFLFFAMAPLLPPTFSAFARSDTVTCISRNNGYNECSARGMREPVIVRQISGTECRKEENWGYNARTGYVWVGGGCSAVFADGGPGGSAGCHGAGCLVDNPDNSDNDAADTDGDPSDDGIDRCSRAAIDRARSMGHNPRIDRIIDQYPDKDGYHVEGKLKLMRSNGDFSMNFLCVWDGTKATVMLGSGL